MRPLKSISLALVIAIGTLSVPATSAAGVTSAKCIKQLNKLVLGITKKTSKVAQKACDKGGSDATFEAELQALVPKVQKRLDKTVDKINNKLDCSSADPDIVASGATVTAAALRTVYEMHVLGSPLETFCDGT